MRSSGQLALAERDFAGRNHVRCIIEVQRLAKGLVVENTWTIA